MRTSIPEEILVRSHNTNVHRALSFVVAVIPLRQVRLDFGSRTQTGQITCSPCPLKWAREDAVESNGAEALSQLARVLFPSLGQRNVGSPRVLAGK